jgi:hypothetical protein
VSSPPATPSGRSWSAQRLALRSGEQQARRPPARLRTSGVFNLDRGRRELGKVRRQRIEDDPGERHGPIRTIRLRRRDLRLFAGQHHAVMPWGPFRRFVFGHGWCTVTRHRLRSCLVQSRVIKWPP